MRFQPRFGRGLRSSSASARPTRGRGTGASWRSAACSSQPVSPLGGVGHVDTTEPDRRSWRARSLGEMSLRNDGRRSCRAGDPGYGDRGGADRAGDRAGSRHETAPFPTRGRLSPEQARVDGHTLYRDRDHRLIENGGHIAWSCRQLVAMRQDVAAEHHRLQRLGIVLGDYSTLTQARDPDGKLIALAAASALPCASFTAMVHEIVVSGQDR